jgi:acetolactate synthase I/III small subunit
MNESVVTVHFTQRFGAVDRIISMLRRRGFPIAGMTLERTHNPELGRMTIVVEKEDAAEQIRRHLNKLADVTHVGTGDDDALRREYALVRIRCEPHQRSEVVALLTTFAGRAISMTRTHCVLEAAGGPSTLDRLFTVLEPYGIEESARTNPMALQRAGEEEEKRKSA